MRRLLVACAVALGLAAILGGAAVASDWRLLHDGEGAVSDWANARRIVFYQHFIAQRPPFNAVTLFSDVSRGSLTHISAGGLCREYYYHVSVAEGDYVVKLEACALPVGPIIVRQIGQMCFPNARDWPADDGATDRLSALVCEQMMHQANAPLVGEPWSHP